jgi:hypothetical protein
MPHALPHGLSKESLPQKAAEKDGLIDMSPSGLIGCLKSSMVLMMRGTTTAEDTAILPMVYIFKNGKALVAVLKTSPTETLNFTPASLGQVASGMGKDAEADAVAVVFDARGFGMPKQSFRDEPVSPLGPTQDCWAALLRIREGDRLWSCAQTYSFALTGDSVDWGARLVWDSANDPTYREMFQLPPWYPVAEKE